MECKELAEKNATNAAVKVLIETLWNVKIFIRGVDYLFIQY